MGIITVKKHRRLNMADNYFAGGAVRIGEKSVPFTRRDIQGRFLLYAPEEFAEDRNVASQYTYLFSRDKSPLSIAIKFSQITERESAQKMIRNYFSGTAIDKLEPGVSYRETVSGGKLLSVYSMRFAVEAEGGVLFGCFNSDADYKDDWRETVLEMLMNIEQK
jgi:hypothetical protein